MNELPMIWILCNFFNGLISFDQFDPLTEKHYFKNLSSKFYRAYLLLEFIYLFVVVHYLQILMWLWFGKTILLINL